jgi:hypothetical protein
VDVAFQHLLCRRAYPDCKVAPYLMLADVSRVASVDGLNQCFFLAQDERGRARVELTRAAPELGTPLLIEKWVRKEVEYLQAARYGTLSFSELVDQLAEAYAQDRMLPPVPGKVCRDCQYRTPPEYRDRGLKSGFELCWHDAYRLRPEDLAQPMVFDVAGLSRADELIARGKLFIKDLELSDVAPEAEPGARGGFTQKQRQWAQVRSVREQDPRPVLDRPGLKQELASHHYPLHMIDFETTRVAIPFTRGRRPYETVAFQFSHHLIHKDGRIEHRTEHLDTRPGVFPNFDFARALRGALGSGDDGTLFRYSHHENTTLNEIRRQLEALPRKEAPADRDELIDWIAGVTTGGDRAMVDLCEIAKQRFYHPLMGKSYSLKSVLPAILRDSARLQAKYAQPVYGSAAMPSLNFRDHPWIRFDSEGRVRDPYQTLEPIFDPKLDLALEEGGLLYDDGDGIREGGAAMTAYARMQFTQMTEPERERVSRALKRYCELDTLAMVFLYEYWQEKVADDQ